MSNIERWRNTSQEVSVLTNTHKQMKKIILAVIVLTFLLSSCASTSGGCGGSYVKNYNMCPAYH